MQFLNNLDLNKNELRNAKAHVLASAPASPQAGQFYYDSGTGVLAFYNGASWVLVGRLDQLSAPTANVSFNGQRLINLAAPVADGDGATKAYVDNIASGIDWKESVRLASTANIDLVTGGLISVDGVTVVAGDRVLVKNQTTGSQNGLYVAGSGGWARATDADTAEDIQQAAMFVREGASNADSGWVLSTNPPITLGTTALTFVQFTGASVSAGAGLTQTGNTIDVGAGAGIIVDPDAVRLDVPVTIARGGTGATAASGARANLGATGKFATSLGDGAATSIAVAHGLGTQDVAVFVRQVATPFAQVFPDVEVTDANTVTVRFATAPTTGQYRVVVVG